MSILLNFVFKMAFVFCYLQLFESKKIGKPLRKLQPVRLYYLDSLSGVVRDCFRRRQRSELEFHFRCAGAGRGHTHKRTHTHIVINNFFLCVVVCERRQQQ